MGANTRIQLPKENQRELIEKTKTKLSLSWGEFADLLNLNMHYLSHELRLGECTLPVSIFERLCTISGEKFGEDIVKVLPPNWGQKKGGGKAKTRKPKEANIVAEKSVALAEIIGVILGDGHLDNSHKSGHYAVKVCGGLDDCTSLESFVSPLFMQIFGKQLKNFKFKTAKAVMYYLYDKNVEFTLEQYGLKAGNKKENDANIPIWIFENECYLKACLRGLFDTDGTVFPKFSNHSIPQLELTSKINGIQESYRKGLLQLGFQPSKWHGTKSPKCGIYSKNQVERFGNEIGFNNPKHKTRFETILGKKHIYMSG
jgi:intein/homing endonuclease